MVNQKNNRRHKLLFFLRTIVVTSLCLVFIAPCGADAAVLRSDGFESGSKAGFDGTRSGGTADIDVVQSTVKASGTYAWHFDFHTNSYDGYENTCYFTQSGLPSSNKIVLRANVRIDNMTYEFGYGYWYLLYLNSPSNAPWGPSAGLLIDGTTKNIGVFVIDAASTLYDSVGTTAFAVGDLNFHELMVEIDNSGTNPILTAWYDGVQVHQYTFAGVTLASFQSSDFGTTTYNWGNHDIDIYFDDCRLHDGVPGGGLDPLIAYSQNSTTVNDRIYYSRYLSGNWTTGAQAVTDAAGDYDQYYKVAKTNPTFTKQAVVWKNSYAAGRRYLLASIWDGTNWDDGTGSPYGDVKNFNTTVDNDYRSFDAAFEQLSGDLLVVSGINTINSIYYWTWNGSTWSSATFGTIQNNGSVFRWCRLAPRPSSDEMAFIGSSENGAVSVGRWTGSAWNNGHARINSGGTILSDAIDIQYVQAGTNAGDIVAVWGQGQYLYTAIYRNNLGSWSANTQVVDLGSGNLGKWLKLKADPYDDDLILAYGATVGGLYSVYTIPYDGATRAFGSPSSAHTTSAYVGASASFDNNRPLDVIWDPAAGSDNVLLVYSDTTGLRFKTSSDRGNNWSSQQNISTSYQAYWVQLERGVNDTIYLAIHDNADDLRTWTWASSTWTAKGTITTDLETGVSNRNVEGFAVSSLPLNAGEFKYRSPITINYSQKGSNCPVSGINLPNFPVLISLTDNRLKTKVNDGNVYNFYGYDIVFRASDGVTHLDHEIERYNATTGQLIAWVRIPNLFQGDANTTIYIYYGNAKITSPTQNPTGVWNSNFKGVWHLSETIGNPRVDSTLNGFSLADNNSSYPVDSALGKIASATSIPAGQTYTPRSLLTIPDPPSGGLDYPGSGGWTYSAWIKPNTTGATRQMIDKNQGGSGGYRLRHNTTGNHPECTIFIGASGYIATSSVTVTAGNWYSVTCVYDPSSATQLTIYVNNTVDLFGAPGGPSNSTLPFRVGGRTDTDSQYYDGLIDEVRVAAVARDACWIGTEYNNMNAPASFITLGSEGTAAPTAVKLTSFTANQYPDGVLLRWKTGYEVNNLGFHVYREENGERVRLTPEPVAGSALMAGLRTALTAGHHYHWWDAPPSPQSSSLGTVKYWLKDIDLNGTHKMHGPVTPIISREPLPTKLRPELLSERGMRLQERYRDFWRVQELKERLALKRLEVRGAPRGRGLRTGNKVPLRSGPTGLEGRGFHKRPDPSTNEVQRYLAGKPAVKLFVREEGWYRVTQPELVAAGLSSRVNPHHLQLYVDGQEQPIRVIGGRDGRFGPRDAIEFYGVGLDTPSTDTRVYWLVEGFRPGKRVESSHSQGGRIASSSFPHTVEVKDRWIYLPAIKNGEEENFFGVVVYGSGVDQLLGVRHLDLASSEDALLEVVLQGATSGPHRVKVYLNNENGEVGEIVFEGQSKGLLQVEVPQAFLHEGDNLVSFIPLGGEMDVSLVDSIRLTYWHTYTADDNGLRLTAQGGSHLTVNGFSHPKIRVIDITDSNDVIEVMGKVESRKGSYAISFRVPGTEQRTLLAIAEENVKSPGGITSNQPSSWHQSKDGYDLVIITHRDFFDTLQPLKKLRESQGLKVALIDVEDLYDEFSFGNKSPKALKDFLGVAKKKWHKPPRFVLLVGDASFDPRNYLGSGELDFVPTKLVDTVYMETASDDWFVDLNSDGLPEMAVGRIPVQTAEEAHIVVSKIIGYEKSSKKNEALLVADRVDNSDDFNFEGASEEIWGLLPSSLVVRKIYRSQFGSDSQANGALLSAINQGPLLVNFIGHGSIEIWRGNILTSEDAEGLVNGMRLPFFVNMTCLNGYFQDPYSETLGEALIKAKQGGAIAVWTSSGLTEPDKQAVMNKELIKLLFGREAITLGEATAKAKASVSDQDIRRTWILFGDPTTRLRP